MAYEFYCTNCASRVNTETVLFDMQELLTGDASKKLQILKFRMTEQELREFAKTGKQLNNDEYQCTLTLPVLMKFIGGEHNLNVPAAAELTMEQLNEFVNAMGGTTAAPVVKDDEEEDLFGSLSLDEPEEEEPEKTTDEQPQEKSWPQAIEDMKLKDTTMDSMEFAEGRLRDDLRLVLQLLIQNDSYTFTLKLLSEDDDKGGSVLYGMIIGKPDGRNMPLENRVCPSCGAKIFPHAGTAEHRAVVFIGDQSSGKTSTILALSHYAVNHLQFDIGSPIWRGATTINGVEEIALLEPALELQKEMANFHRGVAPKKTDVKERDNAYSATFMIKSKAGSKETRRIITLTDLPGELCEWGGGLKTDKILNEFAVALACDTFVTCFDTTTVQQARDGSGESNTVQDKEGNWVLRTPPMIVNDTCLWADKFQTMLMQQSGKKAYVPTMLLFTKCKELEDQQTAASTTAKVVNLLQEVYMFKEEQVAIKKNSLYEFACQKFGSTGNLEQAFHAVMRCSPFGYPAPAANMLELDPSLREKVHLPMPKNIDDLMRWVLMVSGCIPVEAKYRTTITGNNFYELNNYFIDRTQYRCENPRYTGRNPDEGLARCRLFANPGVHDKETVSKYGNKAATIAKQAEMTLRADSNAK